MINSRADVEAGNGSLLAVRRQRVEMFADRVTSISLHHPGYDRDFANLRDRLLGHGGWEVVPPLEYDPLTRTIFEHGALQEYTSLELVAMEPSNCHENVRLWCDANPGPTTFCATGYGLSADGLWRPHSWAIWDQRLVETTLERVQYFGVQWSPIRDGDDVRTGLR